MTPVISVVIPVYQVEKYIENSISSIISQTYTAYEIILVNDGTKDKSVENAVNLLESHGVSFSVINQENKGVSAGRNAGILKSRGEWIVCIDPDDVIAPHCLERLLGAGEKYNTEIVFCNFQKVTLEDIFKKSDISSEDRELLPQKLLYSFLIRKIVAIAPGMLIKKDFLKRNKLWYDETIKYGEDQHFVWKVLLSADKVVSIKDRLYNYLIRPDSTMTSSSIDKVMTGFNGMKKLESEIIGNRVIKKYILPRWVFSAINASSRMMDFKNFCELATRLDYRINIKKLFFFPDLRVIVLSIIMLIDLRLFYRIGRAYTK